MSFAQSDFTVFKNALVYTVAVNAVNKLFEHKDGSVLTLLLTTGILTYGAQLAAVDLDKRKGGVMAGPVYKSLAFVATTSVSIGINMHSTLLGTYLSTMFVEGTHPLLVIGVTATALVMLWILGKSCGLNI